MEELEYHSLGDVSSMSVVLVSSLTAMKDRPILFTARWTGHMGGNGQLMDQTVEFVPVQQQN